MESNVFLAALISHDNRVIITQKIHACEAKRSPLIRVQWTPTNDLHVTLGFIGSVEEKDIRTIAVGLSTASHNASFMANVGSIRLYGSAIVLRMEPYHVFYKIHQQMQQKLIENTQQKYQFDTRKRYDPHVTIGRIRNLRDVNAFHKQQLLSMIEDQFRACTVMIQQAALLRRLPQESGDNYQTLQLYTLTR
ncbi:MAG: 2'-5' RNA ligase family protein [Candidatus Berkiellales bacterium]